MSDFENCLYLGGSGDSKVLKANPSGNIETFDFGGNSSASVYALNVSDDGSLLAAATKPVYSSGKMARPSEVRTFSLRDKDGHRCFEPTGFSVFEKSGVLAVLVTDGSVLLGCGDGATRVFSHENSSKPQEVVKLHEREILALAKGKDSFASMGGDGKFKIWSHDWRLLVEKPVDLPSRGRALLSMAYDLKRDSFVFGDGQGRVHRVSRSGESDEAVVHDGEVLAVCYQPDQWRILSCGFQDQTLRVVHAESWSELASRKFDNPLIGVCLLHDEVAVLSLKGLHFVDFESLEPIGDQVTVAARAIASRDLHDYIEFCRDRRIEAIQARTANIRRLLRERRLDEADAEIKNLRKSFEPWGYTAAEPYQARLYGLRGQHLAECEVWHHWSRVDILPPLYRYLQAKNFIMLNEPELAIKIYEELGELEGATPPLPERIKILRKHPLLIAKDAVRADLMRHSSVLQEIRKSFITKKFFTSPYLITEYRKKIPFVPSVEELLDALRKRGVSDIDGRLEMWVEANRMFDGSYELVPYRWLRIKRPDADSPNSNLEFAFRLVESTGERVAYPLVIPGQPSKGQSVEEWTKQTLELANKIKKSDDLKAWFNEVHKLVTSTLTRLTNRKRARLS